MAAITYLAGAALLSATTVALLKVLVVLRRAWSIVATPTLRLMVRTSHVVARRLPPDVADRFLGFLGPAYIVVLLATFLGLYTVAFALLLAPELEMAWSTAFRESGSSVFTLGFQATDSPVTSSIDIVAGATGMIVIALFIAYLPTLYAAIKDRERFVKVIQGRCSGEAATGAALLACHFERGMQSLLGELYLDAERWAAGIADTHTKYPVLVHFRAPRARIDWLTTMIAVSDAAALHRALLGDHAPPEATAVCEALGMCFEDLAHVSGQRAAAPAPGGSAALVAEAATRLRAAGIDAGPAAEALPRYEALRARHAEASARLTASLLPA